MGRFKSFFHCSLRMERVRIDEGKIVSYDGNVIGEAKVVQGPVFLEIRRVTQSLDEVIADHAPADAEFCVVGASRRLFDRRNGGLYYPVSVYSVIYVKRKT